MKTIEGDTPVQTTPSSPSRRNFLTAMGATVASLNTAACIRKPYEKILPFGKRPEDRVPGKPQFYATATSIGGTVVGLLVKSSDGRPIKVEGNPKHPYTQGGTTPWVQASVLEFYDPQRSRSPSIDGDVTVEDASKALREMGAEYGKKGGEGLAILVDETPSPTRARLLGELQASMPQARVFRHDGMGSANDDAGAAMVGLGGTTRSLAARPKVMATFDADPMGTEGDTIPLSRAFGEGRHPDAENPVRLYAVESNVSLTGTNADHRLAVRSSQVPNMLAALAKELSALGVSLPATPKVEGETPKFIKVLAKDLLAAEGSAVVAVGERHGPAVHALGHVINHALGAFNGTIRALQGDGQTYGSGADLIAAIDAGTVERLLVLGGNPAVDLPGFGDRASKVATVHLGLFRDETALAAKMHIAESHALESWNDLQSRDGTVSIQQPLVAPLYASMSDIEVLARILGNDDSGHVLVQATHKAHQAEGFDKAWQVWLHDGVVQGHPSAAAELSIDGSQIAESYPAAGSDDGFEVVFHRDLTTMDGRFVNSPWLQELPDPVTKLTWDNAAVMSPQTGKSLGVQNEDMVEVAVNGTSVTLPVWIQKGTAEGTVAVAVGYGREAAGQFGSAGFDVSALRSQDTAFFATKASVTKASGTYRLACAQVETSQHGRPIVREATRAEYQEIPNFVEQFEVMDEDHIASLLWEEPEFKWAHQWGMVVDLNSCTGCGACVVACQAENNIPWVGKSEVLNGREMHWIRVDRYFEPEGDNVNIGYQPLNCAQCETAPCENVCPVGASAHSPEGLNDMAYNRCIGTRYCANNCPYKVRRFNFFHYTVRNDGEYGMGIAMQRNPDVTVRYRGVMEKCTYCVQRISRARIDAKVHGDGTIADGAVTTACQDSCPSNAIVFGNIKDPDSVVAKARGGNRNYGLLSEYNLRPRTTYLAKLNNPNPELANG